MNSIVLIGFMGTGKTTISEQLNKMHGMEIVDMDREIAVREKKSISEIFIAHGEDYFRDLETALLIELQKKDNLIISCGGGVVLRERNIAEMKKNGKVVLLTASPETIFDRVKDDNDRPLLKNRKHVDGIAELMEMRRSKYEAAADIMIKTDDKSVEEICKEIINKI